MQKLTNQPIRHKIDHLKVYECKAYSLLKGADAPARDNKLRPRAFVDYLVGYNSTNIFVKVLLHRSIHSGIDDR